MKKMMLVVLMLAVCTACADEMPSAQPPETLTEEGACPFECCTYREWTVLADSQLLENPKESSRIVGSALNGWKVQGLTGVVIVTDPGKIEVLRAHTGQSGKTYKRGDILLVYTERGEGVFKVWHNGELYDENTFFMYHDRGGRDSCVENGTCWGKRISFPKSIWWVKVKTREGIVGWSSFPQNFGGKDACD